jgi:hypothetical protein
MPTAHKFFIIEPKCASCINNIAKETAMLSFIEYLLEYQEEKGGTFEDEGNHNNGAFSGLGAAFARR